jgi:peroxiredoxin
MSGISSTRRNFLAGMGAAAAMVASGNARAQGLGGSSVGGLWRQLQLVDAQDNNFTIGDIRKPLTMVKLWAHWCPVCVHEIAQLDALVSEMGPQALEVILISHPQWWEEDQEAARSRQLRFRLATPDRSNGFGMIQAALTNERGNYAVPRTLVFVKTGGEPILTHQGAMNVSSDSVVAQLRDELVKNT